jgi:hypothetical protein
MRRVAFLLGAVTTTGVAMAAVQPAFALTALEKVNAYLKCHKNGTSGMTCCSIGGGTWHPATATEAAYCDFTDDRRVLGGSRTIGPRISVPSR